MYAYSGTVGRSIVVASGHVLTDLPAAPGFALEHTGEDPKDGELCPGRAKPEETLVEARSGSNVQIDRQTRV